MGDHLKSMAFIDLEASGLVTGGYPIEVAIAFVPSGDIRDWLIRPSDRWLSDEYAWSPESAQVHGITRQELIEQGLPVEQVAREVVAAAAGSMLFTDNVACDQRWLDILVIESAVPDLAAPRLHDIDVMLASIAGGHAFVVAEEQVEQEWRKLGLPRHRAAWDVRRHLEVYHRCCKAGESSRQ
jgi:hypothetical protein